MYPGYFNTNEEIHKDAEIEVVCKMIHVYVIARFMFFLHSTTLFVYMKQTIKKNTA